MPARRVPERRGDEPEDGVAGLVAVAVVDRLEAVDVDEEEAEREPVALGLAEPGGQLGLGPAPVADARERVQEGEAAKLLGALARLVVLRLVLERLDRADDLARGVANRGGADLHRDAVSPLVEEGDVGVAVRAVGDGRGERTAVVAELVPFAVHVAEEVVPAERADDLVRGVAGDPLGAVVPGGDAAVPVDEVDAVREGVQELPVERLGDLHRAPPIRDGAF